MKSLYHASKFAELNVLTPQPTISNDENIGDYLFATENKLLATMYLANKGVDVLMNPLSKEPRILIADSPRHYKSNDRGGAIYHLPPEGFEATPQEGLTNMELVSRTPVLPTGREVYDSSLEAMDKAGITVYFIDQKTFQQILKKNNEDEIVANLKPYKSRKK